MADHVTLLSFQTIERRRLRTAAPSSRSRAGGRANVTGRRFRPVTSLKRSKCWATSLSVSRAHGTVVELLHMLDRLVAHLGHPLAVFELEAERWDGHHAVFAELGRHIDDRDAHPGVPALQHVDHFGDWLAVRTV